MNSISELKLKYQDELFKNILPFWIRHSNDEQNGGYFTSLNQKGEVYDTDKFLWLQARQVWLFSYLFNNAGDNDIWLGFALQGAGFLQKNGRDESGNWYFSLDQKGSALTGPHSIFTDCFAALGFASLFKSTEVDEFAQISRDTFLNILKRKGNPKGIYAKSINTTRQLRNSSLPMILLMLMEDVGSLIDPETERQVIEESLHDLSETFYDANSGLLLENKNLKGEFSDTFEGRLICAGTIAEGMWFVMDQAAKLGNTALISKSVDILLNAMLFAWDEDFGGLFYFQDIRGKPPQQLEWDQKLWWVHAEALTALLKAYHYTQRKECWTWFLKIHDYTWKHFPDPQYGEWFGYLNRRGEVLLHLKGGKWKGCYHIPRMLYQCWRTFEKLEQLTPPNSQ